jgi:hypothetical protein
VDPIIAKRMDDSKGNQFYDSELYLKIGNIARQYVDAGLAALNYAVADFDAATDLVEMAMPIIDAANYAKMDRNHALNFRHPATFTQMITMVTFITEILFGGEVARSVEPQDPNHDQAAEAINGLLAWNDAKIGIYKQGWDWVWNAVVYNRGVWYESCAQDIQVFKEEIEEDDVTQPKEHAKNAKGELRYRKGNPVMAHPKRKRIRTKRLYTGFYNKLDIVSPYDFISDPALPLQRFQEGNFAGHRVMIKWKELKRRSELDPSEDGYVLPEVVKRIKTQKGLTSMPAALGGQLPQNTSRAYYDRQIRGANATGVGGIGSGLVAGTDAVNKDDGGTVECWAVTIRAKPKDLGLYPDDEEAELISLLLTNTADTLSVNVRPNQHDQFPYAPAEARPNSMRQFMPGWALACKPCQDRMDDLNTTHSQAQKRMGNILLIDPTKCDVANLLSPDKNGLLIMRTAEGRGATAEECVKQIPLLDTTAKYPEEMGLWNETMKSLTGAENPIQGKSEDPSQTATQFDGVQQMAMGRISAVARLLSEQALSGDTGQTKRFVENFKQFMPDSMMIRILGKGSEFDPDNPQDKFRIVKKADIQHDYDVVPHDGSLPGADAKVVAAATRAIEAWSSNPNLAIAFDNTVPGSMDPIRIFRDLMKKSGLPVEKFSVTRQQAQQNLQQKQLAAGMGVQPVQPVGQQQVGAPPPVDASGIPSASQLPPIPSASPPPPGNTLPT